MLHHKGLIGILDGSGNDIALHISSVDEIIFIIPVSPGNHRFPDIAADLLPRLLLTDQKKLSGHLPAVYIIDDILQIRISGRLKPGLLIHDKFKGYFRMGKRNPLHQGTDISGLCHGSL